MKKSVLFVAFALLIALVSCEQASVHTHTWDDGHLSMEATCTQNGVMTYTCTVCKDSKTEVVPATGHVWDKESAIVTKLATCEEGGTEIVTCKICGETRSIATAANGHRWIANGEPSKAPTCEAEGEGKVKCAVDGCGATEENHVIPMLKHYDHSEADATDKEKEDGLTESCKACEGRVEGLRGAVLAADKPYSALAMILDGMKEDSVDLSKVVWSAKDGDEEGKKKIAEANVEIILNAFKKAGIVDASV